MALLRLKDGFIRRPRGQNQTRPAMSNIVRGDPFCSYCGRMKPVTVDHITPASEGGKRSDYNITGACRQCNQEKDRKPLLMYLLDKGGIKL